MENFIVIATLNVIGFACAYFAKKQRRNPYIWFLLGFVFGIISLLVLLILPFILRLKKAPPRKTLPPKEMAIGTIPSLPSLSNLLSPDFTNVLWYYLEEGNIQKGPMSFTAFESAWKEGKFSPSTYIWNEKLPDWRPFQEIFPQLGK